ncbi:MAG: cytochrome b5 domain-containing protein [Pseudomonadales bacterium]
MIPKLTFAAFIAFWSALLTLTILWALSPTVTADTAERVIPLAEVQQHDSLDDCWMAIDGEVYDLTDYVPQHPTPPAVLAPWCGSEATEGMRTKGYGRDHSPAAWAMLDDYRIGTLE